MEWILPPQHRSEATDRAIYLNGGSRPMTRAPIALSMNASTNSFPGRSRLAAIYSRTELIPDICGESGTAAFAQDEPPDIHQMPKKNLNYQDNRDGQSKIPDPATTLRWYGQLLGFVVWGDVPTPGLLVGSATVVASGLYILWRETVRRRRPAVPAPQRG